MTDTSAMQPSEDEPPGGDSASTMDLLERFKLGDQHAIELLVERSIPPLQRWARSRSPPWARLSPKPRTWCKTRWFGPCRTSSTSRPATLAPCKRTCGKLSPTTSGTRFEGSQSAGRRPAGHRGLHAFAARDRDRQAGCRALRTSACEAPAHRPRGHHRQGRTAAELRGSSHCPRQAKRQRCSRRGLARAQKPYSGHG